MRVPNLDWAPALFADEPAARHDSPDEAGSMWLKMADATTAGAATPAATDRSPEARLAKAA